jgi:hypothetical protein
VSTYCNWDMMKGSGGSAGIARTSSTNSRSLWVLQHGDSGRGAEEC